jgi:hypothetical protein
MYLGLSRAQTFHPPILQLAVTTHNLLGIHVPIYPTRHLLPCYLQLS